MQNKAHILVIRLSAMGDVAITVPVIKTLSQQYPNTKITVLSKPNMEPLFKEIPNLNFYAAEIQTKHKGVFGILRLSKELKKLEITHIADFHNVIRSKLLRLFLFPIGAKVGKIEKGRTEKKALTRSKHKIFKPLKTSIQRYVDVLESIGFPVNLKDYKPESKRPLSEKIQQLSGKKTKNWIGVAPFAAHQGKMYPLDLMKEVVDMLSKENQVFLFGGGNKEIQVLSGWENQLQNSLCVAGKLSFEHELELISHLDLMLSMDSANSHLAAIYQVPVVSLWGATHPYAGFAPFKQEENCILPDRQIYPKLPSSVYGNKVIPGYEEAMRSILPEQIIEKIQSLIK